MKRVVFAGLGAFAAIAIATAALAPVTIKRIPTKGQKISYTMTGKVSVSGMEFDISSKQVDTITDVAADGTYSTESLQSDMELNGMPSPQQPSGPTKSVNRPDGSLVSITSPDAGAQSQSRLAALTQFYYPSKPVEVNDTWTYEGKKDDKLGTMDFKADMKYLGDEKIGTIDTYKIQEDSKETAGTSPCTIHSTVWVDKTDGSMVKASSTFTGLPVSDSIAVDGSMTITRS